MKRTKTKVWILFSIANEYNQPSKAFEKLFWHKPTYEELKEFGYSKDESKGMRKNNINGCGDYWVEEFNKS